MDEKLKSKPRKFIAVEIIIKKPMKWNLHVKTVCACVCVCACGEREGEREEKERNYYLEKTTLSTYILIRPEDQSCPMPCLYLSFQPFLLKPKNVMKNTDGTPEFAMKNVAVGAGNVLSRRKNCILEF